MQVIHNRCAALDVHKKTVVTTIMITQADGSVQEYTRTFLTMTADLLALDDWLRSHDIKVIAMESTGVFWRPVFNLLEEGRQVILVNAQHMKAVPGRKTDVKDSQWLADLLRHGLLKASFIPPKPVRELRDLMRSRKTIVQERADEVNRLHAYGPNCRTCASPWMDVCSLIIVCCSRAFWRTSTCLQESLAQLQAEMEQYLHPNARSHGINAERGRD